MLYINIWASTDPDNRVINRGLVGGGSIRGGDGADDGDDEIAQNAGV